ncbi:DNA alkylation repair protein, partial [Patescibacteria group bacterium]|nr:DNA alkylation repair protein [Patescibacteria group bacterium]
MHRLTEIKNKLEKLAKPDQTEILQRFFKTGKGQYGEGDIFLGIKVPILRRVSTRFKDLELKDIERLLQSKIHEHRLTALFILTHKFNSENSDQKKEIFDLYIKNAKFINNWDLIDLSAPKISGPYLLDKDRKILYKLAKSKNLWEKRIAIM